MFKQTKIPWVRLGRAGRTTRAFSIARKILSTPLVYSSTSYGTPSSSTMARLNPRGKSAIFLTTRRNFWNQLDGVSFAKVAGNDSDGTNASGTQGSGNQLLRPGDIPSFPQITAIPLQKRPLLPGTYYPLAVNDAELADHLLRLHSQGSPYVGGFLRRSDQSRTTETTTNSDGQDGTVREEDTKDSNYNSKDDDDDATMNKHHQSANTMGDTVSSGIKSLDEIENVGILAQINQIVRNPYDSGIQVILLGHRRIKIEELLSVDPVCNVKITHHPDKQYKTSSDTVKAYCNELLSTLKELLQYNPVFKEQLQLLVANVDLGDPGMLADVSASLTAQDQKAVQKVLEAFDHEERLGLALVLLRKELEVSKLQKEISKKVEEKVNENHRKFLLQEQLKNIKRELGLEKDDKESLLAKFKDQIHSKEVPEEAMKTIKEEMERLSSLEASSSEFNVTRNYLEWLTSLPWGLHSNENFSIRRAERVLDRDHYGLEDVKNRILEFIAVGKRLGAVPQGKIVCLMGPPGVGKTSIGKSIAEALGREFYRFSVGGLFDVAEIKGHRRTYIGAMPGKLIQCLKKTQTSNPVIMIDEIDKIGQGHRGDPSSALLEVLDPSQNGSFMDHYLDVPVDLSRVLFICTANVTESIPGPLADRMEFIRLSGYILQEKLEIAKEYLSPTALKETGLSREEVELTDDALEALIRWYCREAGVRNLQKHINRVYRKAALHLVKADEGLITGEEEEEEKNPGAHLLLLRLGRHYRPPAWC
mmetsp:Transcript_16848/g.27817  ORF Transcript_16848/g.27817 Transcript_16848/m.27817 type:complete len:760 (-) Transcript_16848:324-2603(-)